MKSLLQTVLILGIACSMSIPAFATPTNNSAPWATAGIAKAYEIGIVPDSLTGQATDNISRKDFTLLAIQLYTKITGIEAAPVSTTPFKDIDLPALTFAYENGIISGRTATEFYPDQNITREQMAMIISKTLVAANVSLGDDHAPAPFVDISTLSDGSKGAIRQLYTAKITSGFEGYYYPHKAVTVQEAILAFLNAYEYSNTALVRLADTTETPSSEASAAKSTASEPKEVDQLEVGVSNKPVETVSAHQAALESSITIGNKALTMGQTERDVLQIAGIPDRIDQDSFGFERYIYLNGNADLFFVSFDDSGKVVEIFTPSDKFEYMGLRGSGSKKDIKEIKFEDKRNFRIELPVQSLDAYVLLGHEDNIEGILLRDKSIRNIVDRRYNQPFEKSIILELIDLMNQARAQQGQPILTWNDTAAAVASKHSFNMSKNSFVEYNDNTGKTPFDRMTEGGLKYTMAAELAGKYEGDSITIFHEWMRIIGTRSNILNSSLTHGGVGVYMDNYDIYITADLFRP